MPTPAEDVASALNGQYSLVSATNLFSCAPRDGAEFPAPCVFCWESTGGLPIQPHMGTTTDVYRPSVQIRVRGVNNGYAAARTLARNIRDYLHRRQVSGYISCVVRESAPIDLGSSPSAYPEFGLNVDLIYSE